MGTLWFLKASQIFSVTKPGRLVLSQQMVKRLAATTSAFSAREMRRGPSGVLFKKGPKQSTVL